MRSDIHWPVLCVCACVRVCVCVSLSLWCIHGFCVHMCTVYSQLFAGSYSDVDVSTVVGFVKCTKAAIFFYNFYKLSPITVVLFPD